MHTNLFPSVDIFRKNFTEGKSQILWKWMSADLETPVSAYLKICGHTAHSFLLESVEGGSSLGRYSIIGTQLDLLWRCKDGQAELCGSDGQWLAQKLAAKESLRKVNDAASIVLDDASLPPMSGSGMFGYIGYDMARLVEKIPNDNPDDLKVPDSILMRPSLLVIFDDVKNMICLCAPVYENAQNSPMPADVVMNSAKARLERAEQSLYTPLDRAALQHMTRLQPKQDVSANMTESAYKEAVEKAAEYINAGDIFQVVPSLRFSKSFDLPSFEFYRTLRSVNPSPFLLHISFGGFAIVGSSPEILVRVRDGKVTIRPIAGTRKRGENAAEDKVQMEDLLADPKECAEHLMLLDLGRNDVGRVAKIGSVTVTEKFEVELYSHVMHIISNVEGELRDDVDVLDALFAGFPAGTVSGAPKIRAMEIIDELEVSRRGVYAGGVGYFSRYTMDSCIALRTAVLKDGKIYVQAGAGVVADSVPENEYQECVNKAKALLHAADITIEKFS